MSVTRIRVTRSGGFAGLRLSGEVADPDRVAQLVRALGALDPARGGGGVRDGFVYTFQFVHTVEAAAPDEVSVAEHVMPPALRDLARAVTAPARPASPS